MTFTDTKQTRVVKKSVPTPSFFDFFNPAKPPTDDDEEIDEDIEAKLELDYQLGEDIKEKLIPRAIDWFTGEALQFENDFEDEFDEDEFEDEDDEDEEDLDRDDDDEEEESDEEVSIPYSSLSKRQLTRRRAMAPSQSRRLLSASKARLPFPLLLHVTFAFHVAPLPSEHVSSDRTSHGLLYINSSAVNQPRHNPQVTTLLDQTNHHHQSISS